MLSRKQFFKELVIRTAGAAARLIESTACVPESVNENKAPAFAFTELSPSLLAMEAERLGTPAGSRGAESFRQQLYMQMKRQAPGAGPDIENGE